MTALTLGGITKKFGSVAALRGVDLAVADSEFLCVVGPTNAGKSTLLKVIAGLVKPDRGTVSVGGRDMAGVPPKDRGVSLLFQNVALFPTMTGFDNIAFPLRAVGAAEDQVHARVHEVAALLRVEHVLGRLPRTFSGGEQQRVAIGRALARPVGLLLLDEPLSNLDARLRIALRIAFKRLHRDHRQTMVYVTHDQIEAMSLSDRVAVIDRGVVQQVGSPDDVYHRPANRFVAEFFGSPPMNVLAARLASSDGGAVLEGDGFRVPAAGLNGAAGALPADLAIGVRPENVRVGPGPDAATPIQARIAWVERLGPRHVLDVRLGDAMIKATVDARAGLREGPVWIGFDVAPHLVLDRASGTFLR